MEEYSNSDSFIVMNDKEFAIFNGSFDNCLNFLISARTLYKNPDLTITVRKSGYGFVVTGTLSSIKPDGLPVRTVEYKLVPQSKGNSPEDMFTGREITVNTEENTQNGQ